MYSLSTLLHAIINQTIYNFVQPFLFNDCTTHMDILELFRECKHVISCKHY